LLVIASESEAIQCGAVVLDCFVAALLAMANQFVKPPTNQTKENPAMPSLRNRDRGRRRVLKQAPNDFEEARQRHGAFAAIKKLYCESLPLWRVCQRGFCRRNKRCCGEAEACLKRGWKLFPVAEQNRAWRQVGRGGPRGVPPQTELEKRLRHYPSSNFVL
jgi:hypothetical protein